MHGKTVQNRYNIRKFESCMQLLNTLGRLQVKSFTVNKGQIQGRDVVQQKVERGKGSPYM